MKDKKITITKKLDIEVLFDIKYLIKNQIDKNIDLLDSNTLKLLRSDFYGIYITSKDYKNKDIILFQYYPKENLIIIDKRINEYRIFDALEDYYEKDIIKQTQTQQTK